MVTTWLGLPVTRVESKAAACCLNRLGFVRRMGLNISGLISKSTTQAVELLPNVATIANGKRLGSFIWLPIRCVYVVRQKVWLSWQWWLTISSRIKAISSCFGIAETGKAYASHAMTTKQGQKMAGEGGKISTSFIDLTLCTKTFICVMLSDEKAHIARYP